MYLFNWKLCIVLIFQFLNYCAGQNFWKITQVDTLQRVPKEKLIWCNINSFEQRKCNDFAQANRRDQNRIFYKTIEIECIQAANKDECMKLLDDEKATMTTLDAGSVFMGGRYHSLVPIAQEVYEGELKYYYSVAVVKSGTLRDVVSIRDLRGKKACFPGVETFAGWVIPVNTLMKYGGMDIVDCNNHVKSATTFFGPSCAVNCLSDKYNPIGDNSDKLCQLCIGPIPGGRCTDNDPYAGYEGAFRCLLEAGEVAFLKHTTVKELISGMEFAQLSVDGFELLCLDGSRRPVSDFLLCNWGKVPSDTIVVTSAASADDRIKYQKFLQLFSQKYGKSNTTFSNNPNDSQMYNNRRQPEYDQFGNIRSSRFKRQNFEISNNRNQLDSQTPYNPYSNLNKENARNFNPYNDFNRQNNENNLNSNNNNNESNGSFNVDPYRPIETGNGPFTQDPFARDPYAINRDQYGENIDPYSTDVKYNRNNDAFYGNNNNNSVFRNRDEVYQSNGTNVSYYEEFHLFQSIPRYGWHGNLMFQDATIDLVPLPENQQTYSNFLGGSLETIMGVRDCPVAKMTLCVTSDAEKNKCVKMRTALKAQLLKPEIECYKAHSQINCMQAIRAGTADVTVLDASDVYTAGLNYDLVPFISEVYNLENPEYYVVAVAKESDPSTELTYLKR